MKKKLLVLITCLLFVTVLAAGCGSSDNKNPADNAAGEKTKIVVGATAKPHAEILEIVKPVLAKENVDLEIKVFTDYVQLNPALNEKQIDANFFQHIYYLNDYNKSNKTDLAWTVRVHKEPMGVYSKKITNLDELKSGALVGIPNDTTNGGRALKVLESANLIKLKEGAGVTATDKDIIENPKNIKIKMMDASMLPRSLEDLDACVVNGNYAIEANLDPAKDAIFTEDPNSTFAADLDNVLVVKAENKDKAAIKKLNAALQSPEVKKFLEEKYKGACVPAF